jgi:hypothetical protein
MSDSFLAYQNPISTDKKLDSESLTVGANTVERERVEIAGSTDVAIAKVQNGTPGSSDYALTVRNIPTLVTPTKPDIPTTSDLTEASINISSSGDNTIVALSGSTTIRIYAIYFTCAAAVNITFKDSTPTSLTGAMTFGAGGGMVLDPVGRPWFTTAAAKGFIMNLSGAFQVSGRVYYTQS